MQRYFTITQLTQEFDITTRTLALLRGAGLVSPQSAAAGSGSIRRATGRASSSSCAANGLGFP